MHIASNKSLVKGQSSKCSSLCIRIIDMIQILHVDSNSAVAYVDPGLFKFKESHQGYLLKMPDVAAVIKAVVNER